MYHIRHCLHDRSDKDCVQILKQIGPAIKPGISRLLISESVLPETGVDVESGWMDVTMMTVSGAERTEPQWEKILDESGFKLHKTYHAPGTNFAAIEAEHAAFQKEKQSLTSTSESMGSISKDVCFVLVPPVLTPIRCPATSRINILTHSTV